MTRRGALGGLAAAVVAWPTGAAAHSSADRVRPGARVALRCSGAEAFRVEGPGLGAVEIPAVGGAARLRAPVVYRRDVEWLPLRCTPLAGGRPLAAPLEIAVLVAPPVFGA